jgi:hypothetical protein
MCPQGLSGVLHYDARSVNESGEINGKACVVNCDKR